jgi:hypothetical protein
VERKEDETEGDIRKGMKGDWETGSIANRRISREREDKPENICNRGVGRGGAEEIRWRNRKKMEWTRLASKPLEGELCTNRKVYTKDMRKIHITWIMSKEILYDTYIYNKRKRTTCLHNNVPTVFCNLPFPHIKKSNSLFLYKYWFVLLLLFAKNKRDQSFILL